MKFIYFALLFFSYLHGEAEKTIGIFTQPIKGLEWDPESIYTGITGSEEAVIYISQKLSKLGYRVTVFGNPPETSPHSTPNMNPRFIKLERAHLSKMDIAISWRMPEIAEALRNHADKVYFWPHDVCTRRLTTAQIQGFDDVLWLSKWQRQQWISINPPFAKFTKIFGNGINAEQFKPIEQRKNPYACIYGSNYARGLEILLDLWPTIKEQFPQATLDVYYGWQHWGLLSSTKEAKMRVQMAELADLDVQDHGLVGHEELNRAYERASFWTYPCTGTETFCISALRAQTAGAIPVVIAQTALKETVQYGHHCLNQQNYLKTLLNALQHAEEITLEERQKARALILDQFTWDKIAYKWHVLFQES